MPDEPSYRLPRTVSPVRYDIALRPDLKAFTFSGTTATTVTVHEPVDAITLNAIELDISSARLGDTSGSSQDATVTYDEAEQQATFTFAGTVEPGDYTLHTEFTGILNDKLHGFYRSTFTDDDGNEQVIATTQFEATDAAPGVPVLGRARPQGRVRRHARHRRRADRALERSRRGRRSSA